MYVNHSGWNAEYGSFSYDVFVDEKREDYEIHYKNGTVDKQAGPFQEVTADWNNDGDVYTQFGAWFRDENGRGSFWTPEQLVMALIETLDGYTSYTNVSHIPGITLPARDKRPALQDTIEQSERRAFHQEAERNRKMDMLGIRPPNEPWAK